MIRIILIYLSYSATFLLGWVLCALFGFAPKGDAEIEAIERRLREKY